MDLKEIDINTRKWIDSTQDRNYWGVLLRRAFTILTGTPTGKRPLGGPRRRWEDNIKMYLKEICINTREFV